LTQVIAQQLARGQLIAVTVAIRAARALTLATLAGALAGCDSPARISGATLHSLMGAMFGPIIAVPARCAR